MGKVFIRMSLPLNCIQYHSSSNSNPTVFLFMMGHCLGGFFKTSMTSHTVLYMIVYVIVHLLEYWDLNGIGYAQNIFMDQLRRSQGGFNLDFSKSMLTWRLDATSPMPAMLWAQQLGAAFKTCKANEVGARHAENWKTLDTFFLFVAPSKDWQAIEIVWTHQYWRQCSKPPKRIGVVHDARRISCGVHATANPLDLAFLIPLDA